jgi:virginiamycin B lyase
MSSFVLAARLAVVVALGTTLVACGAPGASAPATVLTPDVTAVGSASAEPTASASTLLDAWTVATLDLGGGPDMPTEAFGSLWVLAVDGPLMNDGTEPAVHRIDPETVEVIASVPLPGRLCQGIGASPEAIWACGPDGLVRIDPETNTIVATIELDAALAITRIAYGAGSVWAFATETVGPDLVVRIDPATNAVTATIQLQRTAGTLAFGFDALWVTSPADGLLMRIDPATNEVETWTEDLETPGVVVVAEDALWVSLFAEHGLQAPAGEPAVVRIDPVTGEVVASVVTGGSLGDEGSIAPTSDAVWVRAPEPWLVRIDPATNEVVDVIDTVSGPGDIAVAFGAVWVTTERGELIRLEP